MAVQNGDQLRVSARQSMAGGQDHVSVFYWLCNFTQNQTDQDVADGVIAKLDASFSNCNPYITNGQSKVDVKIDKVEFVGGVMQITDNLGTYPWTGGNYVPGGTGEVLPPGVAGLVKFLTYVGKSYGRKFIGGITEATQNDGLANANLLSALAAFAAGILVDITISAGNTLAAGIMSQKTAGFLAFQASEVSNNISYQRRRRLGTGS